MSILLTVLNFLHFQHLKALKSKGFYWHTPCSIKSVRYLIIALMSSIVIAQTPATQTAECETKLPEIIKLEPMKAVVLDASYKYPAKFFLGRNFHEGYKGKPIIQSASDNLDISRGVYIEFGDKSRVELITEKRNPEYFNKKDGFDKLRSDFLSKGKVVTAITASPYLKPNPVTKEELLDFLDSDEKIRKYKTDKEYRSEVYRQISSTKDDVIEGIAYDDGKKVGSEYVPRHKAFVSIENGKIDFTYNHEKAKLNDLLSRAKKDKLDIFQQTSVIRGVGNHLQSSSPVRFTRRFLVRTKYPDGTVKKGLIHIEDKVTLSDAIGIISDLRNPIVTNAVYLDTGALEESRVYNRTEAANPNHKGEMFAGDSIQISSGMTNALVYYTDSSN